METHQLLLVSGIGLAINLWGMWATGGHHHHGHSHGHDHAQVHAAPKVVSFRWNRDISYWLKLRRYTNREYPKMTLINMKIIILIFTVMTITTNLAPYVSFPLANSLSCFLTVTVVVKSQSSSGIQTAKTQILWSAQGFWSKRNNPAEDE